MATEQVASFDQATLEAFVNNLKGLTDAWMVNLKGVTDAWQSDWQQQGKQRQGLQDALNEQHLRFADDQHTLVMRMLNDGASASQRATNNSADLDKLAGIGGLAQVTELRGIGAQVAQEASEAATAAVNNALAQTAQTAAAPQGTTGVAQGGLQTGSSAVNTAMISNLAEVIGSLGVQLAKIQDALAVILVKVTAEGTVTQA